MTENSNNNPTPGNEKPLESWKEIATYLQRDVRTVRRWEKNESLPVRRHQHQARSSVYAYPSELGTWLATRQPTAELAASRYRSPASALAMAAALLLALASVASGPLVNPPGAAAGELGRGTVARQVWSPTMEEAGAVSPDGRYLSFIDWETGDMAVRNLATGEQHRLTDKGTWQESGEYAEDSVFSPDSQQVVFGWFNG
ncbi:MAG: hypothetical protein V3R29_06100, partial [Candidatus Acidoferrales bacterium]